MAKVTIKRNEENPEDKVILAQAIIDVAEAGKALLKSGLNRIAITILIQNHIGANNITRAQIIDVLDTIPKLADLYTSKK